jgi:hypothetical protein
MSSDMGDSFVASRQLLYARKGTGDKRPFRVLIGAPIHVEKTVTGVALDSDAIECRIRFEGLDAEDVFVYGADTLQALSMATSIDPYLRSMMHRFDFYWPTHEPYF